MKYRMITAAAMVTALFLMACESEEYRIYGTGTFEAIEIQVSTQVPGLILSVSVAQGQAVQKNQVLAQIDVEKFIFQKQQIEAGIDEVNLSALLANEQVSQVQIQYANIKKRYDRFTNLFKEKSISQQQIDDLKSQFEIAEKNLKSARIRFKTVKAKKRQLQAQLKLIERQIADGTVYSPLDGVILQKLKQAGELAMLGAPLVRIANLSQMEITIYVSEIHLGVIKLGEELSIQVDSFPDKTFKGPVSWISPKAEFTPKNVQTKEARTSLVYAVKLTVKNPAGELKIGMPADVFLK